ncbi:MAG: undecaprenyldiphospho-muramoylpentapeptide beta-N-acetylglucosaminyltransferase [Thermoanaerobaculia bacterium]
MGTREDSFVLAGGGTGGHVFPAVAVAREIRRRRPEARVLFVGTARGLEARAAPREGFPVEFVSSSGFVGTSIRSKAAAIVSLLRGFFQARSLLRRHRVRAVLGVGGYASLPVVLAARSRGVPAMIQEQNSVPGVANRLAGRFAAVAAVGFEAAVARFGGRAEWTGNPVRSEFFEIAPLESRPRSRAVFFFGGSQGSRVLNRALMDSAAALAASGVRVVAQTGEKQLAELRAALEGLPGFEIESFFPEIWKQLEAADLVICRAGALTLAELCAAGRPAVLVPFAAAAHGHQEANARQMEAAGAAVVIREEEAPRIAAEIESILASPERLLAMGRAARSLARPDATARIVDLFLSLAEGAP